MLKIITHPNPILRQKSQPVTDVGVEKIQRLIPQMIDTMLVADGVGLAAPQIGENIRIVVIQFEGETYAMINPRIIKKSFAKEWGEEGCLSLPGLAGEVKRHKKIALEFTNEAGKKQILKAEAMLARIAQHEIDHLDGILFIDKAKKIRKFNTDE